MTIESESHSYRKIFRRAYGDGPHDCYFCGDPVTKIRGRDEDSLVVHHADGNHHNHTVTNLVSSHYFCHASWHSKNMSAEQREQLAEAARGNTYRRGKKASEETRQKQREAHLGKRRDPEAVQKTAAANRGKKRTPEQIERLRAGRWGDR